MAWRVRRRWPPLHALLVMAAVTGCNALFGTDGLSFGNPPADQGGGGTGSGANGQGAAVAATGGSAVPCATALECPGEDEACRKRSCSDGFCGVAFEASGTPIGPQTAGDCQRSVCDGEGAVVVEPDAADIPSDANGCTVDACADTMPTHTNATAGIPCGDDDNEPECDATGACIECNDDDECGTDSACVTFQCDSMPGPAQDACVQSYADEGDEVEDEQPGDCLRPVCNGLGDESTLADDDDLPDDLDPCTFDLCVGGGPWHPPRAAGTSCGPAAACDASGQCAGCTSAADCGETGDCVTFLCNEGQCGAKYVAPGMPAGAQLAGDCHANVCDGAGSSLSVVDDADTPSASGCNYGTCSNGVPGEEEDFCCANPSDCSCDPAQCSCDCAYCNPAC